MKSARVTTTAKAPAQRGGTRIGEGTPGVGSVWGASRSLKGQVGCLLWIAWVIGWAMHAWHLLAPASWNIAWSWARHMTGGETDTIWVGRAPDGGAGGLRGLGAILASVLDWVSTWGSATLFVGTGLLLLYWVLALGIRRRHKKVSTRARLERLRAGGRVLEVIVPTGSRADAGVMSSLLRQLWDHLAASPRSRAPAALFGGDPAHDERAAISLEMLGTAEGVGFYIWLPAFWGERAGVIETLRDLISAHYTGCRVRLLDTDRLLNAVGTVAKSGKEGHLLWADLALQADSHYPIAALRSASTSMSTSTPTRGGNSVSRPGSLARAGVGGASADALGSFLSLLGAEPAVPLIGAQVVVSVRARAVEEGRRQIRSEKAQLREMEAQYGKRALGPEHEERVRALEEKDQRYGYDTQVRLLALASGGDEALTRAEQRLEVLLRAYRLYNRSTAGVEQGFATRARGYARLIQGMSLRSAGAVLGRWHRDGLGLPPWLHFMGADLPQILSCDELAAVYHFPHEGLEKIRTVRVGDRTYLPIQEFTLSTEEEISSGATVLIAAVEEDMPGASVGTRISPGGRGRVGTERGAPGSSLVSEAHEARPKGTWTGKGTGNWWAVPPGKRAVGLTPSDLTRGLYVLGSMGSGKSGMMLIKIHQHLLAGEGVGLIDPKTDLFNDVILRIPPERERDVVLFDPGSVGRTRRVVGLNPLDARTIREHGAARVSVMTMDLIKKIMGASWDTAVRMKRFLHVTLIAVLQAEMAMGKSPTLMSIYRCLKDEDGKGGNSYRDSLLPYVKNPIALDFWRVQFPAMGAQQRQSLDTVLTRIEKFILDDDIRSFVAQPGSTLNAREIMDKRGIFLANITSQESVENQVFLGAIVSNMFLMAAMSRRDVPQWAPVEPGERDERDERGGRGEPGGPARQTLRPYFHLHLDEFQNFVVTEAEDIEKMLSMCRAFHLCLTIAHQYTGQLPQAVLDAISSNVQTMVLFSLQGPDAPRFSAMFPEVRTQDWLQLPKWHSYQRALVKGDSTKGLYSAGPLNLPPLAANQGEEGNGRDRGQGRGRVSASTRSDVALEALRPLTTLQRGELTSLAHDDPMEPERERLGRLHKLAGSIWHPSDMGETWVVDVLSLLSARDFEVYRQIRLGLDRSERERLLARPSQVPDKKERIERLSALAVGTPQVEVDAWVHRMTRSDGTARGGGLSDGQGNPVGQRGVLPKS